MAETNKENTGMQNLQLDEDFCLETLRKGKFKCEQACSACGNSDPSRIEVLKCDSGDCSNSLQLTCTKCNKHYSLTTPDEDDDDEESPFCSKCENKEPDCFEKTYHDSGQLHKIKCLVCDHVNTFHSSIPSRPSGSSDEPEISQETCAGIECIKCPNTEPDLFDITFHPDGRIHKISCIACGHGNTFHDKNSFHGNNNPRRNGGGGNSDVQAPGFWSALKLVTDVAVAVAEPLLTGIAQLVVGGSTTPPVNNNDPANRGNQAVNGGRASNSGAVSGNQLAVQNGQQMVAGPAMAIGQNMILQVGNKFLKKVLPEAVADNITRSLLDVIKLWAGDQIVRKTMKKK